MAPLYRASDWQREVVESGRSHPWRSEVARDYGRVVHSASFRRLQGKTQVFPGHESDFFRNRLTHSLEVAQIAQGIASRINYEHSSVFGEPLIDLQLCQVASLVHDIGHPPFGHNGERALDNAMKPFGGFEGNAQSLRILARLEKKTVKPGTDDGDNRAGLNLTYRTLAAALKYDAEIPGARAEDAKLAKGYYGSEKRLVSQIKGAVLHDVRSYKGDFKTIECAIMDVADDIAYSTYDLEDCLKARFLTPARILSSPSSLLERVAQEVNKQLKKITDKSGKPPATEVSPVDIVDTFAEVFPELITSAPPVGSAEDNNLFQLVRGYRISQAIAESAYVRTALSSRLVNEFINAVEFTYNSTEPAMSTVDLSFEARKKVEILKQYTFLATIHSPRVKLAEFKGDDVVLKIFEALSQPNGDLLMPDDMRERHASAKTEEVKKRIVCDFVAGMTDRYALEFYGRLYSDVSQSMFKPIG